MGKLFGEILDETQAAEFIGVSKPTFRNLVENGEVPFSLLQTSSDINHRKKKFFIKSRLLEALLEKEVKTE